MKPLLTGKLVRLAAMDTEEASAAFTRWDRDSEMMRLLDSDPAKLFSSKKARELLEQTFEKESDRLFWFSIRAVEDDRLLGDINLGVTEWNQHEAYVGLGIGSRENWSRGYGTEAMQLVLEYAFLELNLDCVLLTVFEYNPRAIRSYEKCGFHHDGRVRGRLLRDGKRWDMLMMSIRRSEWMENNGTPDQP